MTQNEIEFEIRKCINPDCGLRFSMMAGEVKGQICPICRSKTQQVRGLYGRNEVSREENEKFPGVDVEVLLDNIRSVWNVGAMIRTADGAGVKRIHLCGVTAKPDHPRVMKTSLGAERAVEWVFHPDGVEACRKLQSEGYRIWALEGGNQAVPLFQTSTQDRVGPIVLVVGNELTGVDPDILELCERVVFLPMQGVKGSLNVAVAFGIAVYHLRFGEAVTITRP
jgi:23S rRNA (guanosine2251-2'-O)-methyltransferase